MPEAWRFVFLDPATSGNCRIVTVAARTSSEHPDTVEAFGGAKSENGNGAAAIPQTKLLVDSDRALEQIRINSKLKGARAAEYKLLQRKGTQEPVWMLEFYGEDGEQLAKFRVGAKTAGFEQN